MAKVAIVTDSSACIPTELMQAQGIRSVPITFLFDGDLYHDGILTSREFYALLRSSRKPPTTAAPAPAAFLDAFRQTAAGCESVLCITLPSSFSGTHSSALNAVELARQELPDLPIRVVDSGCLAMCHGFAVLAAARAAEAGAGMDDVEAVVRHVASRAHLIGALDTLRFLAKSGRVPTIFHWATSLLRIKPILAADGADVRSVARVRTMTRALDRMLVEIERRLDGERPLHMAVMHADAPTVADGLGRAVRERFQPDEILVTEFTSGMGVHTGPGFVGIAFYSGEPAAISRNAAAGRSAGAIASTVDDDASTLERVIAATVPSPVSKPCLVLVCGLPGSGKSHFSRALRSRHPLAHLDSDALRRALFTQPTHSPTESERLFAAVRALVERLLSRGVSVMLDATSLKEAHRRPLYEIAERAGAGLVIVQTDVSPATARQRLEARARGDDPLDASEATPAVYDRMVRDSEPIERQHIRVDTSEGIEPALKEVVRRLDLVSEGLPK